MVSCVCNITPAALQAEPENSLAWGSLNLRIGAGDHELDTYGDVFAPVWQDSDTVLFLDPYSRHATGADTDAGTGLGLRRLITDDWAVGFNAFYDHSWTRGGSGFDVNQFGVGVEVVGTAFDFRANGYLPENRNHVTDQQRVGERVVALDQPFGTGHRIAQNVQVLGINRQTLMAASHGWDAEIGMLVPWLDRWIETRAYLGGYWYANQAGPDLKGLKARAQARLTQWLYADAGWIEDKAVAGGNWFAGFRISLPLGRTPSSPASNSALMSNLGYRSVAHRARERMNEGVERNGRAVVATVTTRTTEEGLGSQTLTLRKDVVFVDSKAGLPVGPGTFEQPLSTIQGGVNRSAALYADQGTVFVQGRPSAYAESVVIRNGVQLYGSRYGLPVISPVSGASAFQGRTATAPAVSGGFLAHDIDGPVGIAGFELTGGLTSSWVSASGRPAAATSIFLENVGHAVVTHNDVHGSSRSSAGIYVEANGSNSSDVLISGNAVHDNSGTSAQGVVLVTNNLAILSAVLSGNTIVNNRSDGVVVATFDSSTLNATFSGNTIGFNGADQIVGLNFGGALNFTSAGTLSNTVLETPGASSLYEFFSASPNGSLFINGVVRPADANLP